MDHSNPDLLISRIEEQDQEQRISFYQDQLNYIEQELANLEKSMNRWAEAFEAGVPVEDFRGRAEEIRRQQKVLTESRRKIERKMQRTEEVERKKTVVRERLAKLQQNIEAIEVDFDEKRRILTLLVDRIEVDVRGRKFRILGIITGEYGIDEQLTSTSVNGKE
jgi:predicted  nucleic acid-binding Zn-ribbon protein